MKVEKELCIVIRDDQSVITGIITKNNGDMKMYGAELLGFDEIADALEKL